MKVGRKLANKLLNVSKFVLGIGDATGDALPTDPVDLSMLAKLDDVIAEATAAFEGFDYARALERTESFFWWFCDDYVELVKGRGYGSRGDEAATSARSALRHRARARCSGCSRRSCRSPPRRRGAGGRPAASTSSHGRQPVAAGGDPDLIDAALDVLGLRAPHEDRGQGQPAGRGRHAGRHLAGRAPRIVRRPAAADLLEAGSIRAVEVNAGDHVDCEVDLADLP